VLGAPFIGGGTARVERSREVTGRRRVEWSPLMATILQTGSDEVVDL
jgi:hypothetical protein